MSSKSVVAIPPYPRLGEVYNALAQALDTKSKSRNVERLAREGDFDWSLLSGLREELILAPLRRYIEDDAFIRDLDQFIQHVHASYLEIVSKISLDSMSRDEALPILVRHYFAPHAVGLLYAVWADDGPNPFSFLDPENYPLEVVLNWADPNGSHALSKAAFPGTSGQDMDSREKVVRWANGSQLPDLVSLKIFLGALAKNGTAEHKQKAPQLRKYLLLARALTWFEREGSPLPLRLILNWLVMRGDEQWDVGKILSEAAFKAGQSRRILMEPYMRVMESLDRVEPKYEGSRVKAEKALADFAQHLETHDPEGRTRYALEWYRGRLHVLSGEYEEALEHYRQAVELSDYRAGEEWKKIVEEAMTLAGYLGNKKPFLKQLKHRAIALGLITAPVAGQDVVEHWEIEDLRKRFHHLFPQQGRFCEAEQPDDDVGALPFLLYDPASLANREPNYRRPDQVVTVRAIDNQVRRWSQLSLYASFGEVDVVKKLLERGATVDILDSSDGSPLLGAIQRAADRNEREVLDLLLSYPHSKSTLNRHTARKRLTPLIAAIEYGEEDIVAKLVAMGADANLRGHVDDQTPLYLCIRNMGGLRAVSSLRHMFLKSLNSQRDPVQRETLRRYGIQITGVFGDRGLVFDDRYNPKAREIADACVDQMVKDFLRRHNTEKQLQIARSLLAHGANPNAAHSYPTAGRTPLMLAVENDTPEAVELLIRYGGDPFIRDKAGDDCLRIANGCRSEKVIRHFRRIGVIH